MEMKTANKISQT